jgi:hypothetical protein
MVVVLKSSRSMYVIIHAEELVSGNDNMKRVLECAVGVN